MENRNSSSFCCASASSSAHPLKQAALFSSSSSLMFPPSKISDLFEGYPGGGMMTSAADKGFRKLTLDDPTPVPTQGTGLWTPDHHWTVYPTAAPDQLCSALSAGLSTPPKQPDGRRRGGRANSRQFFDDDACSLTGRLIGLHGTAAAGYVPVAAYSSPLFINIMAAGVGSSSFAPATAEFLSREQQQEQLDCFSDFLVDYVCEQTKPSWSRYRQAAETLAKSNLNPNAKVFTPKTQASAATATAGGGGGCGGDPLTGSVSGLCCSTETGKCADLLACPALSPTSSVADMFVPENLGGVPVLPAAEAVAVEVVPLPCSGPSTQHNRSTSESSTDSFIQFTACSPPQSGPKVLEILVCDQSDNSDDEEEQSDDDDEDDEDSDWDWNSEDEDEADGCSGGGVFVDMSDFKDFLPSLCLTNLTMTVPPPLDCTSARGGVGLSSDLLLLHPTMTTTTTTCSSLLSPKKLFPSCPLRSDLDAYPVHHQDQRSLAEVNQRWRSQPPRSLDGDDKRRCGQQQAATAAATSRGGGREPTKKFPNVRFNLDPTVILEPEEEADQLREARISDFGQRQADRERMERLLAPILTPVHRAAVWQRLAALKSAALA